MVRRLEEMSGMCRHQQLLQNEEAQKRGPYLQMQHMRSQRSFWMLLMWHTGSMRVTSFTDTSGIHCMQAAWHHRSSSSAGFRAPPDTGHKQHCGGTLSCSCKVQALVSFLSQLRQASSEEVGRPCNHPGLRPASIPFKAAPEELVASDAHLYPM